MMCSRPTTGFRPSRCSSSAPWCSSSPRAWSQPSSRQGGASVEASSAGLAKRWGQDWPSRACSSWWFQTSINFGMGVASASATIGFYTPDWDWAVQFMNNPSNQFFIILAWLAYYWGLTWISTHGVKAFARLTKYGVIIGTFIPLAFIVIFTAVWLAQGNVSNVTPTPEAFNPFSSGFSLTNLALAAGVFFSFAGIDMNAAHIKQLKNPQKRRSAFRLQRHHPDADHLHCRHGMHRHRHAEAGHEPGLRPVPNIQDSRAPRSAAPWRPTSRSSGSAWARPWRRWSPTWQVLRSCWAELPDASGFLPKDLSAELQQARHA